MFRKLYYCTLLCISLTVIQGQSPFDVKKHESDKTTEKPRFKARVIDGSKHKNNLRSAPKQGLKISDEDRSSFKSNPFSSLKSSLGKSKGSPIFIVTKTRNTNARAGKSEDPAGDAYKYLIQLQRVTGIEEPKNFKIKHIESEPAGDVHVRLQQQHAGFPIFDAEVIVHLDQAGNGKVFNGKYHKLAHQNFKASLNTQVAINLAIDDLATKTKFSSIPAFHVQLLDYKGPEVLDTVIVQHPTSLTYQLAYHIAIRPNVLEQWEYFIDAATGTLINAYKNSCHADGPRTATANDLNGVSRSINTYQEGNLYYMSDASKPMYKAAENKGWIHTLDAQSTYGEDFKTSTINNTTNNFSNNPTAVSAHHNANLAYEYYRTVHNRNSIDNDGGTIYSIINVVDEDGTGLDNAYWNGKAMFYGNGSSYFKPLAGSMDVAGHEMTHGVVQNSANLIYQGEPGAINESMADIFGCMMDSSDWLIGEEIIKGNGFPSGAMRSLINPHNGGNGLGDNGWQPKHVNEKYNGTQDNGGVHINSGIPNHAFYLYATALGSRHRASKIFYKALTTYLTKSSKFIDLRLAVIQSAKDLYGDNSLAVTEAAKAFDAVGIVDGEGTDTDPEIPLNKGDEYLLFYNLEDPIGLWAINKEEDYFHLSENEVHNKPSVTDNGQYAVYVGTDHKIHSLQTNVKLNSYIDEVIQSQAIWSSVAVSKDGSKIAAVTVDPDTSIYVFDLAGGKSPARFMLYNPTFSEGIKAAGPVFADGLEWDYSGQHIVYDAFNELKSASGNEEDDIKYWDINIINVWDNAKQDTASGEIFKLISNLEPGESIGNPTFSKTSPNILAFDYVVEDTDESYYGEIGVNLETNDIGFISNNYSLGWPSYNSDDSQLAFTSMNSNEDGDIYAVALNANKISSDNNPTMILQVAKWGIFYSVGERDTQTGLQDISYEQSLQIHPNPTSGILQISPSIKLEEVVIYDKVGQRISNYTIDYNSNSINVSDLKDDVYVIRIKEKGVTHTAKFSKIP